MFPLVVDFSRYHQAEAVPSLSRLSDLTDAPVPHHLNCTEGKEEFGN